MKVSILGSLDDVLCGRVSEASLTEVQVSEFAYGLGAGAQLVDGKLVIAEAILVDSIAYAFSPRISWQESSSLMSPFFVVIPSKPKHDYQVNSKGSLQELYQELIRIYPKGCVVSGKIFFSNLEGTYVIKSPIYNERVLENIDQYVEKGCFRNSVAQIFAVISPDYESRIFYERPDEKGSSQFFSHTHALINGITVHVLSHSKLIEGSLFVEAIEDISSHTSNAS